MPVVFIRNTDTSPWSRPGDWSDSGHTIEMLGAGGNGGTGAGGSNAQPSSGGGGGAYIKLAGTVTGALGSTVPFRVSAASTSTADNTSAATLWESATFANCYYAESGQAGRTAGTNVPGGNSANRITGSPSPVTYGTLTGNNGGSNSFIAGGSSYAGGTGGGGAGGPNGAGAGSNGTNSVSTAGATGGGGANGGGGVSFTSTSDGLAGGTNRLGQAGGAGGTTSSRPGGNASNGGAGGGGARSDTTVQTAPGGTGAQEVVWTRTSDSLTAGPGGGGGGGGGCSANSPGHSGVGGAGGGYGSGGGGGCAARSTTSTRTGGAAGPGIIVATYTLANPTGTGTLAAQAATISCPGVTSSTGAGFRSPAPVFLLHADGADASTILKDSAIKTPVTAFFDGQLSGGSGGHQGQTERTVIYPPGRGTTNTTFANAFGSTSNSWQGLTFRQIIPAGYRSAAAGGWMRIKVKTGTGNSAAKLAVAFAGLAALSGDPYDFDGNQVQIGWSTLPYQNLSDSTVYTSDWFWLPDDPNRNVVVSIYFTGTAVNLLQTTGLAPQIGYYAVPADHAQETNANPGWTLTSGAALVALETSGHRRGPWMRIAFRTYADVLSADAALVDCFVGFGAAAGNDYDFDGAQVRVTFNGQNGIASMRGEGVLYISDWFYFPDDNSKKLIASFYWSGTNVALANIASANCKNWYAVTPGNVAGSDNLGTALGGSNVGYIERVETGGHQITPYSNAQIDTAQSKFGGASLLIPANDASFVTCDGSNDYALGAGDFTIDFWTRLASNVSTTFMDFAPVQTGGAGYFAISFRTDWQLLYVADGDGATLCSGTLTAFPSGWHHIAVTRASGVMRIFFDGVLLGSGSSTGNFICGLNRPTIGSSGYWGFPGNGGVSADTWFDEVRIIKGFAAWTESFTPTTAPYAGRPMLLLHFDGVDPSFVFTDSASNQFVEPHGNARISGFEKFGTGAGYFDGVGDYLTVESGGDFAFGVEDFTVDFWAYTQDVSPCFIDFRSAGGQVGWFLIVDGVLRFAVDEVYQISDSNSFVRDAWTHYAVCRKSGSTRLFVNGTQVGSTYADSNNYVAGTGRPIIGAKGSNLLDNMKGWIDELRIIRGYAAYTTNFTVPSVAYGTSLPAAQEATVSGTGQVAHVGVGRSDFANLLLHFDGADGSQVFEDSSVPPGNLLVHCDGSDGSTSFTDTRGKHTVRALGTAQVDNAQSKFGGTSAVLDGSSWLSAGWSPRNLGADLVAWFDASDASTVTLVSGSKVSSWADKSGNGRHAIQNTDAYRPTYASNAVTNGLTYNALHVTSPPNGYDICIVATPAAGATGYRTLIGATGSANHVLLEATTDKVGTYSNTGFAQAGTLTWPVAPHICYATVPQPGGNNIKIALDGNALQDTGKNDPNGSQLNVLGNYASGAQLQGFGNINEIVVLPVGASDTIKQKVEGYLAHKWGLAANLPSGHPYKVGPPPNDALAPGTGDFTIDFWCRPSVIGIYAYVIDMRGAGESSPGDALSIRQTVDNYWEFCVFGADAFAGGTVTANVWQHIAVTRTGGTVRGFVNGVEIGSRTIAAALNGDNFYIGSASTAESGFGGSFFTGWIDEVHVTKGYAAWTGNFTPPLAPYSDPHIAVAHGNAQIDTGQGKFGGSSLQLTTAGDYVSLDDGTDLEVRNVDFTIDFWTRIEFEPTLYARWFTLDDTHSNMLLVDYYGTGQLRVAAGSGGGTIIAAPANSLTYNVWHHVAVTRQAGQLRLFFDGVLCSSAVTDTSDYLTPAGYPQIGDPNGARNLRGWIDEFRIVKGYCLYTSNFTPPAVPYSTDAGPVAQPASIVGSGQVVDNIVGVGSSESCSLLLHCDGTDGSTSFPDRSGNAHTVTAFGNAQVDTAQGKFGTASALFDGSGDWLRLDGSSDFAFGTGDFTVELFFKYATTSLGVGTFFIDFGGGTSNAPWLIYEVGVGHLRWHTGLGNLISVPWTPDTNWHHLAVARSGATTRMFLDGVVIGTDAAGSAENLAVGTGGPYPYIGIGNDGATGPMNGWIDEIRIIKGRAAWTSNFTPPPAPYSADAGLRAAVSTVAGTGSVATTINGTGVLAAQASVVAGAGTSRSTGTGTPAAQAATVSSSGTTRSTGTGTPAAQASTVAGSGTSASTSSSAAVAAQASTVAGAGPKPFWNVTGVLNAQASAVAGSGTTRSTGTGTPAAQSSTVAGSGVSASTSTVGALSAQAAAVSGSGSVGSQPITGTGTPAAQAASVAGAGTSASTGTGTPAAQSATVAGTGVTVSTGTGTLAGQSATVAATGTSRSTGTGVAAAQGATVSGTGTTRSTGTGNPSATAAAVAGSGTVRSTGTGTPAAQSATVAGVANAQFVATGVLAAQAATVAGAGTSSCTGTGVLQAAASTVAGIAQTPGSAILLAQAATVAGVGITSSTGTSAAAAQAATVAGVGASISSGTATLAAQPATVAGTAALVTSGTGVLQAGASTVVGLTGPSTGTGTPSAGAAAIAASGTSSTAATGDLAASGSVVAGVGISGSTGTGTLIVHAAEILGADAHGDGDLFAQSSIVVGVGAVLVHGAPADPRPGTGQAQPRSPTGQAQSRSAGAAQPRGASFPANRR